MLIDEEDTFLRDYDTLGPWSELLNQCIQTKMLTYDSYPSYEIQELTNDGWRLKQIDSVYDFAGQSYKVIMKREIQSNSPIIEPTVIEIPIPSTETMHKQISILFEHKWHDI